MQTLGQNETQHDVVIAGGGPTGLMLAAELALAGVDAVIVERRDSQQLEGSRAMGLHTRTLEVFDQRGVAERFISQGKKHPAVHFQIPLDISDLPTRHNYTLGLWQRPPWRGRAVHRHAAEQVVLGRGPQRLNVPDCLPPAAAEPIQRARACQPLQRVPGDVHPSREVAQVDEAGLAARLHQRPGMSFL